MTEIDLENAQRGGQRVRVRLETEMGLRKNKGGAEGETARLDLSH